MLSLIYIHWEVCKSTDEHILISFSNTESLIEVTKCFNYWIYYFPHNIAHYPSYFHHFKMKIEVVSLAKLYSIKIFVFQIKYPKRYLISPSPMPYDLKLKKWFFLKQMMLFTSHLLLKTKHKVKLFFGNPVEKSKSEALSFYIKAPFMIKKKLIYKNIFSGSETVFTLFTFFSLALVLKNLHLYFFTISRVRASPSFRSGYNGC